MIVDNLLMISKLYCFRLPYLIKCAFREHRHTPISKGVLRSSTNAYHSVNSFQITQVPIFTLSVTSTFYDRFSSFLSLFLFLFLSLSCYISFPFFPFLFLFPIISFSVSFFFILFYLSLSLLSLADLVSFYQLRSHLWNLCRSGLNSHRLTTIY